MGPVDYEEIENAIKHALYGLTAHAIPCVRSPQQTRVSERSAQALACALIRNVDQAIAAAHVLVEQAKQRPGDRSRSAVANPLIVPLDDRRHLDRAAEKHHLTRCAGLRDRDVANLDACKKSLLLQGGSELEEPQRGTARKDVVEL